MLSLSALGLLAWFAVWAVRDLMPSRVRWTPYLRLVKVTRVGDSYRLDSSMSGIASGNDTKTVGELLWKYDIHEGGRFGLWHSYYRRVWRAEVQVDRGAIAIEQASALLAGVPAEYEVDWLVDFATAHSPQPGVVEFRYDPEPIVINWSGIGANFMLWAFVPLLIVSVKYLRKSSWELFNGANRRLSLLRSNRCPKCGYDTRGLSSPRCPECGESLVMYP